MASLLYLLAQYDMTLLIVVPTGLTIYCSADDSSTIAKTLQLIGAVLRGNPGNLVNFVSNMGCFCF